MSVDAIQALQATVADLQRRIAVLEAAAKPLADQLTPPILRPTPAKSKDN